MSENSVTQYTTTPPWIPGLQMQNEALLTVIVPKTLELIAEGTQPTAAFAFKDSCFLFTLN